MSRHRSEGSSFMPVGSNRRSRNDEVPTAEPRQLPDEYVCIAPDEAVQLFDYLNKADDKVDQELVAVHLGLCLHCQEAVAALTTLDSTLRKRRRKLEEVLV